MKHFFLRDARNFPVACIASALATPVVDNRTYEFSDGPLQPDSMVVVALAMHNPADSYDRRRGRTIAESRLSTYKGQVRLQRVVGHPIKHLIMQAIANPSSFLGTNIWCEQDGNLIIPKRVRDAAAHWLLQHPLKPRRPEDTPNAGIVLREGEVAAIFTTDPPPVEACEGEAWQPAAAPLPDHTTEYADALEAASLDQMGDNAEPIANAPTIAPPESHITLTGDTDALDRLMGSHRDEREEPWSFATGTEAV